MKNTLYIIPMLAVGMLAVGCSKDDPFGSGDAKGEGSVLKEALDVTKAGGDIMFTKAADATDVDIDNFQVSFLKDGQTPALRTYKYGEMPDVVTLPAASYKVLATYGEDRDAAWENPYYVGESADFDVIANEITSYIDPVVCELKNVKVTIAFDASLKALMSEDSYVEVKVGKTTPLNYTLTETEAGKAGYFKYQAENSLVATFYGTVDGGKVCATKSYDNVNGGCWYKLTFTLHTGDPDGSGSVDGGISVDATVTTEDVNADVTVGEDEPMDDSDRPTWGDDPTNPDDPDVKPVPDFVAVSPGLVFDTPWNVTAETECKFKVVSKAEGGISAMTCDIISDDLNADELGRMGLKVPIDLVNTPADQADILAGLNFPTNVGGRKDVELDMTSFMGMMAIFGDHRHEFKISVTDANGTVTKSLILQF